MLVFGECWEDDDPIRKRVHRSRLSFSKIATLIQVPI